MYPVLRRLTVLAVVTLIVAPLLFWFIHELKRPVLWAEDRLERRECRECLGTGREPSPDIPTRDGRCIACRGVGDLDVIVPGPHRPTRLKGLVVDRSTLDFFDTYSSLTRASRGSLGHRPKGAVGGARITLTETAESAGGAEPTLLETTSNPFGRFLLLVPPGSYDLRVEAESFRPLEERVEVERLTAPIWLEKARIIRESGAEEARSLYGLEALVALSRDIEGAVSVRVAGP